MLTRHNTHLQVIKALAVVEGQGRRDFLFFVQVDKQDFIVTVTRQAAILQSQVCVHRIDESEQKVRQSRCTTRFVEIGLIGDFARPPN